MNRKVLITGVSKGLGYELAKILAVGGHDVAGCSRRGTGPGGLKVCSAVDVSDFDSVLSFSEEVFEKMGTPDLVINNAAVMNEPVDTWEIDPGEFKSLIDINITGIFNVIKAFTPAMIDAGESVIVNLSSGWGRSTSPQVAPYCASKYAVEGLSMAMSQEVPDGLCVVSLNPGFINTEMVRGVFGEGAASAEDPALWAKRAARYILSIKQIDNGRQLTVM